MASPFVLPLVVIAFCTWAVYLGGLAAIQANCASVPADQLAQEWNGIGFAGSLQCSSVLSYWWFVMSIEFVAIVFGMIVAVQSSYLTSFRGSALGLFVICTILYIQASQAWYSLQVNSTYWTGDTGAPQIHKIRTIVAGAIMTAVVNGLLVIALGMRDEGEYETREVVTVVKEPQATATAV